jgi:PadR family transcriptional regulator AphA
MNGHSYMNVRTLCLGILAQQDASGYEIKKAVEEGLFAHFIDASYGSIYPALTQMLADGHVSVSEDNQPGKPPKKVYSITETGRVALRKALHVTPKQDKYKSQFLFQALFKADLAPDHLEHVFEEQLAYLRRELAQVEDCSSKPSPDRATSSSMAMATRCSARPSNTWKGCAPICCPLRPASARTPPSSTG